MRAIVVEHRREPGALKDLPDPVPGARELLVRISAVGVNPVDWKQRDLYDRPLPFILGQDFAGLVVGVGNAVQKYAVDDRIFGIARDHGAYTTLTVVPEDDPSQPVTHIPDDVGDADAAALPTAGLTALAAVERLEVKAGEAVLVVGVTGGVGQYAAQIVRDAGATVVGTGSAKHADAAAELGLAAYVPYDREDVVRSVRARYPEGVDVVIDVASDGEQIKRMADVVRPGGRIGSTIRSVDEAYFSTRGFRGINVNLVESPQSSHDGLRRLAEMVEQGRLRVRISVERNLTDGVQALELQKTGGIVGKIILTV